MPQLSRIDYPNLEILILDDDSEDGTAALVASSGSPAHLLHGMPLPPGWLGKNWACAQLAKAARGDILLFCDADVSMTAQSVRATVDLMHGEKLDALTCLPRQILGTWAEKAVLPVLLFLPVLGFLPIAWIRRLPMPQLSLGCGQWFAFSRACYGRMGGHAAVKGVIVEDMALGRMVKEKGMVLGATLSSRYVSTRMYTGFRSVWEGFSKNMAYLTGTGWLRPPLVMAAFLAVNALPWLFPWLVSRIWLIPFCLWLASRLLAAIAFKEPRWGWLWSPVGALLIPAIAARSWWGYRKRTVRWKGRTLVAAFGEKA